MLFQDIVKYHSDIVWVKCLDIWHKNIQPVPEKDFETWFDEVPIMNFQKIKI